MITVQSLTQRDIRKFRAGLKKLTEFATELDGTPHRRRRRRKAHAKLKLHKAKAKVQPAAGKPAKAKRSLQTVPDA